MACVKSIVLPMIRVIIYAWSAQWDTKFLLVAPQYYQWFALFGLRLILFGLQVCGLRFAVCMVCTFGLRWILTPNRVPDKLIDIRSTWSCDMSISVKIYITLFITGVNIRNVNRFEQLISNVALWFIFRRRIKFNWRSLIVWRINRVFYAFAILDSTQEAIDIVFDV